MIDFTEKIVSEKRQTFVLREPLLSEVKARMEKYDVSFQQLTEAVYAEWLNEQADKSPTITTANLISTAEQRHVDALLRLLRGDLRDAGGNIKHSITSLLKMFT